MINTLYESLDRLYPDMVEVRRYLHQHPELSFEEVETPAFIADYHRELGHEVRTEVGGRGVVSVLHGRDAGPTVALRADFDALPIQDEKDVPYKSKVPGVMHACGHDAHTSQMLALAKALNGMRDQLSGTIVFIHQHAEEISPGGAIDMIRDGCLDGVDVIFGTHLWSIFPFGTVQYRTGPMMAAADRFDIRIKGRGGHGGQPHLNKDAVVVGSQLVTNLQQLVSRRIDPVAPAVLSIGSFHAGKSFNVIADQADLSGTVRTFNDDIRRVIEEEMERMIKGTCLAAGVDYDFEYFHGYPPVDNHAEETHFLAEVAQSVPGVTQVEEMAPQMSAEDFAHYLKRVKGTYFFTGAGNPDWFPHHHPKFDIDERAMLIASKTLGAAALTYLKDR